MINITINGKTKRFNQKIAVYDVLNEFDPEYLQSVCAVKANGKKLSLEDTVSEDCEMELLTFRDLGGKQSVSEKSADELTDSAEYGYVPSSDEIAEFTMMTLDRMIKTDDEGQVVMSKDYKDDGDPFDEMARIIDELDELDDAEGSEDNVEQSLEDDSLPAEDIDEPAEDNLQYEASENDDSDYSPEEDSDEEIEPEYDGEFASLRNFCFSQLSESLFDESNDEEQTFAEEYETDTPAEPKEDISEKSDDAGNSDIAMMMFFGTEMAQSGAETEEVDEQHINESGSDYSIDDGDMNDFISAQAVKPESGSIVSENEGVKDEDTQEIITAEDLSNQSAYDVDDDSIDDFVNYETSHAESSVAAKPAYKRGKRGIPAFAKAALIIALLLGVGWGVGRLAIQAVGSSGVKDNGNKAPVSMTDVSATDFTKNDNVESIPSESDKTTEATESTVTSSTADTTTQSTTTTKKTTTKKTTTTTKKTTTTTKKTTTTTKKTTTTTKKTTTTTKKTTTKKTTTTTKKTTAKTKKTTSSTTEPTTASTTEPTTASTTEPTTASTTKDTTTSTTKVTTASTTKVTTASTTKVTTAPVTSEKPSVPTGYDPDEVVG